MRYYGKDMCAIFSFNSGHTSHSFFFLIYVMDECKKKRKEKQWTVDESPKLNYELTQCFDDHFLNNFGVCVVRRFVVHRLLCHPFDNHLCNIETDPFTITTGYIAGEIAISAGISLLLVLLGRWSWMILYKWIQAQYKKIKTPFTSNLSLIVIEQCLSDGISNADDFAHTIYCGGGV